MFILDTIVNEMTLDEIVQRILSHRGDLSREEIIATIDKKKVATGGLLTDEATARLVAAELGIEIEPNKFSPKTLISQLVSGLSDVTVTGRVLLVNEPKKFTRTTGDGQVARLLIADKTGRIKILLWDNKAEIARRVRLRQIVKVLHGYVRRSRSGGLELHVGQKGDVQIISSGAAEANLPPIEDFLEKIANIDKTQKDANIAGMIKKKYAASTFQRKNETRGKVMRVILEDESGQIPVVFWNEKADEATDLREGTKLLLLGARVKVRDGGLELHAEDSANFEVLDYSERSLQKRLLKDGMNLAFVEGTVVSKPVFRKVKTKEGEEVSVASFELEDESGKTWISAWRRCAEKVANLPVDTRLRLSNVYVRKGFGGQLEINTRASTLIEVVE